MIKTNLILRISFVILELTLLINFGNTVDTNGCSKNNYNEIQCMNFVIPLHQENNLDLRCNNGDLDFNDIIGNPQIFRELKDFPHLKFTNCKIQTVQNYREILKKLNSTKVQSLSIANSPGGEEWKLEKSFFTEMVGLKTLDISGHKGLITISPNALQAVQELKNLHITNSNLKHIPPTLFENLDKLQYLNFYGCQLEEIVAESFKGASNVETLDLSENPFETLNSDVFEHLRNLKTFWISKSKLKSLPNGLFSNNPKLENFTMKINDPELQTLPFNLLSNLTNLKKVEIEVGLKSVPETVFHGSDNIEIIKLRNNKLEKLPKKLFQNKQKLKQLYLSNNRIVSDISGDICNLASLEDLYLNQNKIENFCDSEPTLEKLEILDLSNNHLSNALDIKGMRKLEILNLTRNDITEIEYDFIYGIMKDHLEIDLAHNKIKKIDMKPQHEDGHYHHMKININNNSITCDCENFHLFDVIKSKANHLENSKKPKTMYTNVKFVYDNLKCASPENLEGKLVRDVKLLELLSPIDKDKCPDKCKCTKRCADKTMIVDCSNAGLNVIPKISETSLEYFQYVELNITNNNIRELGNTSELGYSKITKIYATRNQISEVKADQIPANIKVLYIDENKITSISKSILFSLEEIKLKNNPVICDCHQEFLSFIKHNHTNFKDFDQLSCLVDEEELFIAQTNYDVLCPFKYLILIYGIMILGLLSFTLGLCVVWNWYKIEIKVWLYAHKLCMWFITEEELDADLKYDAFVSYSHEDEKFVETLAKELEEGDPKYKLNIHVRDFIPGKVITEEIYSAVQNSRRTIIVLSQNYLKSEWAKLEFRTAHQKAIEDKRARVIVVVYGDLKEMKQKLDADIAAYIKTNTYIEWEDRWFWWRLKYALPNRMLNRDILQNGNIIQPSLNGHIDNLKNGLIKSDDNSDTLLELDSVKIENNEQIEEKTS